MVDKWLEVVVIILISQLLLLWSETYVGQVNFYRPIAASQLMWPSPIIVLSIGPVTVAPPTSRRPIHNFIQNSWSMVVFHLSRCCNPLLSKTAWWVRQMSTIVPLFTFMLTIVWIERFHKKWVFIVDVCTTQQTILLTGLTRLAYCVPTIITYVSSARGTDQSWKQGLGKPTFGKTRLTCWSHDIDGVYDTRLRVTRLCKPCIHYGRR